MLACCGPERQLNGGSAQERQRAAEQGCDDNRQCVRARAAEQGRNGGCAQDWGSARRRLHARLGRRGAARVNRTVGNRLPVKPVRTGSGSVRYETGPNSKFKFKFKKLKKSQKNPINISRCDESNGVKFAGI